MENKEQVITLGQVIAVSKRISCTLNKKSSGKPIIYHLYEGYEIGPFFKQYCPFSLVEFYAKDGFALALSQSEVCKSILLVDSVDGNKICREEGLTLVIPSDSTSRRWCKYITQMKVRK